MPRIKPDQYPRFIKTSDEILSALGNESRLQIMKIFLDGEISVGDLSNRVGLSQSALSQHLRRLRNAQLVSTRRESQSIYYRCDSSAVGQIMATLNMVFGPKSDAAAYR